METWSCLNIKCRIGAPRLAEWTLTLRYNDEDAWHWSDWKALASSVAEVVQVVAPRWVWEKIQAGNQERSSRTAEAAGKMWEKPKGRCWEGKRILSFIKAFPFYKNLAGLDLVFWFLRCVLGFFVYACVGFCLIDCFGFFTVQSRHHDASCDLCVCWAWKTLVTAAEDFVRLSNKPVFLGVGKWRIPSRHCSAGMKH